MSLSDYCPSCLDCEDSGFVYRNKETQETHAFVAEETNVLDYADETIWDYEYCECEEGQKRKKEEV